MRRLQSVTPLTVSTKALTHFRSMLQSTPHSHVLVGVKGGGCNGLKYYVEPTSDGARELDVSMQVDDVSIIVCGKSLLHLIGTTIEWTVDPMGSRLEFVNPNATSKCGCGETFTPG